jgi:hypothetical protein
VHRKGREGEEKKEDLLAKSVDKNCMLYLKHIIAQFYGRSPRERVNHIYFVLCVIDILSLSLIYCDCIVVLDLISRCAD